MEERAVRYDQLRNRVKKLETERTVLIQENRRLRERLKKTNQQDPKRDPESDWTMLLWVVSYVTGVHQFQLLGKSRLEDHVAARAIMLDMWVRTFPFESKASLGRRFNRNRASLDNLGEGIERHRWDEIRGVYESHLRITSYWQDYLDTGKVSQAMVKGLMRAPKPRKPRSI